MSREAILASVRAQQGEAMPLPSIPAFGSTPRDELVARFTRALEEAGGTSLDGAAGGGLAEIVRSRHPDAERIVSTVDGAPRSTVIIDRDTAPADLVRVELAIVRGELGVSENGAVWIDGAQLPHRALPFVAEHLVIVLARADVVSDMHAAYGALAGWRPAWGAFISGPSKTADIEQSLVIGAQGARTVLVVLE